jgi:sugar phosphate isomerase/epimerase
MKKSIVVSNASTIFSALDFKINLEENIEKIASLGFDGAELHVRNPKDLNVENVVKATKENNLEVPTIGTGQAYTEEGLSFSDSNEIVRKMAVKRIKDQIIFASRFNSQVTIGSIMGKIEEGVNKTVAEEWAIYCLRKCTEFAKEYNVRLALEPLNRYERNFINTLNEGIEFIKDYITHIHFADSNRWTPGYGHLDFAKIVQTLKKIGYQGHVSAEALPLPDPDNCARLTIEALNKLNIN